MDFSKYSVGVGRIRLMLFVLILSFLLVRDGLCELFCKEWVKLLYCGTSFLY